MNIALRLLSGIALALPLAAAQAFDLEHSTGTLHLDTTPSRIVSYDLGVLDSLDALGIQAAGVPKSAYQGSLEKYNQAPVIGTLFEPDYDALKRIAPELIIAGRRSQPAIPQLQAIAPTVLYAAHDQDFLKGLRHDTLVMTHAPGANAPAARPEPGTPEYAAAQAERARIVQQVAQADPDWLIVLDRGAINQGEKTAAHTLAHHPDLSQTRAFQSGQVYYADPNGWYVVTTGLNNLKDITDDLLGHMQ